MPGRSPWLLVLSIRYDSERPTLGVVGCRAQPSSNNATFPEKNRFTFEEATMRNSFYFAAILLLSTIAEKSNSFAAEEVDNRFQLSDVFDLEYASEPQISPDGKNVVFVRNSMDIMKDRRQSCLWIVNSDGENLRPLTSGNRKDSSPRWSHDGRRIAYISKEDGSSQIYCRWLDTGQTAKLTNLTSQATGLTWSPDGKQLAFFMHVPDEREAFIDLPQMPEGAEWAEPPKVIRNVLYRHDGEGYVKEGYDHLFVIPAEGGTPRQLTRGSYQHEGPGSWTPNSRSIVFSGNRSPEWEHDPRNSEIYEVSLIDGSIKALTDRKGPDSHPVVSPDGKRIAYLGYDDHEQGYQVTHLYVMNRGRKPVMLAEGFDRTIRDMVWSNNGKEIYVQYDDHGTTKVGAVTQSGAVNELARDVGGTTIGRPYASGSFTLAQGGAFAFTHTSPEYPADVAVGTSQSVQRITFLNKDLLSHKSLAQTEEFSFKSSHDGREIQGWIVKPPDFDTKKKYPLILEIHGGPFANYGWRFSTEIQLYAAAGYVIVYINPRGSTGYGEEFGNLIHHAYPGNDYDDLMSGVDAVIDRGFVDEANLFVTGGSGGGVLTAWVVGKTDRFRAAVSAKPVINWYSFALTTDAYTFFYRYWFPGFPWEHPEQYLRRSPISLVGSVTTPTMVITGEEDYRTPISESEQFYQALKLRKVDTMLVRIPGSSHAIVARPSNMMRKVAHILKWFETHRKSTKD